MYQRPAVPTALAGVVTQAQITTYVEQIALVLPYLAPRYDYRAASDAPGTSFRYSLTDNEALLLPEDRVTLQDCRISEYNTVDGPRVVTGALKRIIIAHRSLQSGSTSLVAAGERLNALTNEISTLQRVIDTLRAELAAAQALEKFEGDICKYQSWKQEVLRHMSLHAHVFSTDLAAVNWVFGLLSGDAKAVTEGWDRSLHGSTSVASARSASVAVQSVLTALDLIFEDKTAAQRALVEWEEMRQECENFHKWMIQWQIRGQRAGLNFSRPSDSATITRRLLAAIRKELLDVAKVWAATQGDITLESIGLAPLIARLRILDPLVQFGGPHAPPCGTSPSSCTCAAPSCAPKCKC